MSEKANPMLAFRASNFTFLYECDDYTCMEKYYQGGTATPISSASHKQVVRIFLAAASRKFRFAAFFLTSRFAAKIFAHFSPQMPPIS
jgi:hypothetical protein